MREIKFRAWHQKAKRMFSAEEMAADQLTLLPTGQFINVSGMDERFSRVIDCMVPLQYTGIKDRNGNEIYEGDVVAHIRTSDGSQYSRGAGMWLEELAAFDMQMSNAVSDQECGGYEPDELEVLGNIFENRELFYDPS